MYIGLLAHKKSNHQDPTWSVWIYWGATETPKAPRAASVTNITYIDPQVDRKFTPGISGEIYHRARV